MLFQSWDSLSANSENIGFSNRGVGIFSQSGGTNTITSPGIGYLTLADQPGSTGTYNLSGTGILSPDRESIGGHGTGTFNHTGGTNTTDWFFVGGWSGSTGEYNLSDTGELSANQERIGASGTGVFNQSGGTNKPGDIFVGDQPGSTGTYNQSGGTNSSSSNLTLGNELGSTGTYNLSDAGALSANNESIGYRGTGTFNQSAGANTLTGVLTLGQNPGSVGSYDLRGTGALSAWGEQIGGSGAGTFTQTGGTNMALGWLNIAQTAGGTYNLGGGTLNATTIINNDRFNYSGGTLNGSFTRQTFSNNTGATFTLSGSGTRTVNASVTNAGTVNVTGTTAQFAGTFVNNGALNSDPATLEFFGDLTVGSGGSIHASTGDQYLLHQNFLITSSDTTGWTTSGANLTFTGAGPHSFSLNGLDLSWNGLSLENGATLDFASAGSFHAAVLSGVEQDANKTITNLLATNGFTLFYDPSQSGGLSGIYHLSGGGTLTPVPLPGAALLAALGLSVAGWRLRRKTD